MSLNLFPIISSIQKIALYETKSRFYLVGSNNTQTRFRVLKIDRMEPKDLMVVDDKVEYSQDEIRDLVNMIDLGNRNKSGQRPGSGATKVVSAFGIVGFVRFLEGYYIILVTKRRRVAAIGQHTIYKIEDTTMIYIPNSGIRHFHPDEPRYVKMFQNIDLSSNFYFSYSYDISNTLQINMAPPRHIQSWAAPQSLNTPEKIQVASDLFASLFSSNNERRTEPLNYAIRSRSNKKFVWNDYLLKDVEDKLHPDWMLTIVHGFVGQSNLSVFGRCIYITIIARRSNKYAGTRFLKRGANFEGDVANEVETEQIVHDSSISSFSLGHFTSFVQLRGSVPAHWSQDISKMVPKPAISLDLSDPYAETAGAHFNELLKRYGSPITILNLVKKREKKKHESILSEEFMSAVNYLNQFLPPDNQIQYISFDMARTNKLKEANVMAKLRKIAYSCIMKTGIFQSQELYNNNNDNPDINISEMGECGGGPQMNGRLQTGLIRVNCVDCLDRTNTAQFALGKCALALQLCALGVLKVPSLDFDSDCVRLLEGLYEDHGDTLALQYGGSQLVHRIKTYRKTAPWTSQGNDIMQTLSRYYSNTFSDAEKQHTINLFLGLFIPSQNDKPIWDMPSDYYLHHKKAVTINNKYRFPLTKWWDDEVLESLPNSYDIVNKSCSEIVRVNPMDEMVDSYFDYYRPFELSVLEDVYDYKMTHSLRDFMPHCTPVNQYSPFLVRVRPGRRREEVSSKNSNMKNPSMTGLSSTGSAASSTSSSSADSDDSEDEFNSNSQISASKDSKSVSSDSCLFQNLFPAMAQTYGISIKSPKVNDISIYEQYVLLGNQANTLNQTSNEVKIKIEPKLYELNMPIVSEDSKNLYKKYTDMLWNGADKPNLNSLKMYQKYSYDIMFSYKNIEVEM